MFKSIIKGYKNLLKGKELVTIELAEAREIADLIVKKIERKIEVLEAIESSVDEKILTLQRLIDRLEILKDSAISIDREKEVVRLLEKGLRINEIAETLDLPVGEVELILRLHASGLSN